MRATRWSIVILALAFSLQPGCSCNGGNNNDFDAMTGGPDAGGTADADLSDGGGGDGGSAVMSITGIIPSAASRAVDTDLTVTGLNIAPGAEMTLENCDTTTVYDLSSSVTVAGDGRSLTTTLAADPTREQGLYTVTVTNPDLQSDSLQCAFRIVAAMPPIVTDVEPLTAYRGVSGDGVNSDQNVAIKGDNFEPTPAIRFVKTDNSVSYDALFVGYQLTTDLSAIVPSETLGMQPGDYWVYAINPDLLEGQWMVSDGAGGMMPGVFTVTQTPPPIIDALTTDDDASLDSRIPVNVCTTTTMTITGSGFDANATVWWIAPAGTTCAGSTTDPNGNLLCPVTVNSSAADTITCHFDSCPPSGGWPIVVINPDTQRDTFRNVEIRNSNSGHLSSDGFSAVTEPMNTGRFRHAAEYGFDAFGNAYIYAIGGQATDGTLLGDTEVTRLDVFGTPGPFNVAMQYQDADNPRVVNAMKDPREGGAAVRVGKTLYMMGGALSRTDVVGSVAATNRVESARILSYFEMPAVKLPRVVNPVGLPTGSWYYRVSAVNNAAGPPRGWGEGLATREVLAQNEGGQIEICWDPPEADDGSTPITYNIYRSRAADGRSGTAAAIAMDITGTAGAGTSLCFTDDGQGQLAPAPANLRGVLVTPSTGLAAGDHIYRVSSNVTLPSTDPWESYAGYSVSVQVTAQDVTDNKNAIQLTWDPITDSSATYSVYKWNDSDGQFELLDGAAQLTGTTFTDDGAAFASGPVTPRAELEPLPPGSLSWWTDDPPDMLEAREGLDAVRVDLDPATTSGIAARIIVAGGRPSSDGTYSSTAESLGIAEDGTVDSAWFAETPTFSTPRAFYALLSSQHADTTDFPPDPEDPPCGDLDGDGYTSCDCGGDDCNDADPNVHPGATEICGDGIDQDCDAGCTGSDLPCACSDDADGDGHISIACGGDDCCDVGTDGSLGCSDTTAGGINPDATEICGDGIDQDCDGNDSVCNCQDDLDGDGHISIACGGDDCCDVGTDTSLGCTDNTAPNINPAQPEICGNGIDDNCDGAEAILLAGAGTAVELAGGAPGGRRAAEGRDSGAGCGQVHRRSPDRRELGGAGAADHHL